MTMELHEQIRQAIAASIDDCIRNDASFRSYADAATEAVMKVLEKQEPVAWAATDETCRVVEALGFNKSKRFDTPLCFATSAKGE